MKKKIFLCLLCGILLVGVTGCGNEKDSNNLKESSSSNESSNGEKELLCTREYHPQDVIFDYSSASYKTVNTPLEESIESTYTFEDGKLITVKMVGTYKYDSAELSEDNIEEEMESRFDNILELTGVEKEISHKNNKSVITVTFDYNELPSDEKETTGFKDMSYKEVMNKLNESPLEYCYDPDNKEKTTTPSKIEGKYIVTLPTRNYEEDDKDDKKYIIEFKNDKITTYTLNDDGERENETDTGEYTYKKGKLEITAKNYKDEYVTTEYTVKANYKGYDIVVFNSWNQDSMWLNETK